MNRYVTLLGMQLHDATTETLPVPLSGSESTCGPGWRDRGPDVLSSHALFRGTFLQAASPNTAHNARALVTAALADWRLLPLLDDVVLCASELVSNAAKHGVQPVVGSVEDRRVSVGVRCWRACALFLEVGDHDPRMPRLPGQTGGMCCTDTERDLEDGGRGLLIVQALSDGLWWRRAAHGGKVVYCRFHLSRYGVTRKMVGL